MRKKSHTPKQVRIVHSHINWLTKKLINYQKQHKEWLRLRRSKNSWQYIQVDSQSENSWQSKD